MAVDGVKGAYQVKVDETKGVKGSRWTDKGWVTPNTVFSYLNTEGQTKTVKINPYWGDDDWKDYTKRAAEAKTYLAAMNPYSTKENPDITPKEVFQIKENITRNTNGERVVRCARGGANSLDSAKRSDYFQLLDLYSDVESDGGKNITPEEQSKVVDTFAKWYYNYED